MNLEIRSWWARIMYITFMNDLTSSSQRHVHQIYRKSNAASGDVECVWESVLTPSVVTHQLGLSSKCLFNRGEIRVDGNFFKVFPYIICRAEQSRDKTSATVSSQLLLLVEKYQNWHTPQLVGETVYSGKGLIDWFSKFSSLMSQAKIWWPVGWTSLTDMCTWPACPAQ